MPRARIFQLPLVVLILLGLYLQAPFAQEQAGPSESLSEESIGRAVKKAIVEIDQEKDKRQAQLVSNIKAKLKQAVQEWINQEKQKREPELNKLSRQIWDLAGDISYPVPFDYFLRDYEYLISKTDLRTDSLISPYKAEMNISERLYIESNHHSDASDPSQYFYTVSRTITLQLEYQQDKFVVKDSQYSPVSIEQGWSKNK